MNSIRFPNVSCAPMSRRSLFRGVGVTLALLLLDAISPAVLTAAGAEGKLEIPFRLYLYEYRE